MQEIEAKILEVDVSAVRRMMDALGATVSFDDEMHALHYDTADRQLLGKGCTLRLRKEGPQAVLAFKRKSGNSPAGVKVAEETETAVADFQAMRSILEGQGYTVVLEMRKPRIQYDLGTSHVVIDTYRAPHAHIPPFVEIESPDGQTLHEVAGSLGFGSGQLVDFNSAELLAHYSRSAT